jgi:hypothetical protein
MSPPRGEPLDQALLAYIKPDWKAFQGDHSTSLVPFLHYDRKTFLALATADKVSILIFILLQTGSEVLLFTQ